MKQLKLGVLLFGLIGVVTIFLPSAAGEGVSVSMWDVRALDSGVYIVLGAFAVAVVMGALGLAKGFMRWQAIVALLAFALAVVKTREGMDGPLPAKLMLISAGLGLLCSIAAVVKPEKA